MGRIIAALQVSLDGFIEGPNKDVNERHALELLTATPSNAGAVSLSYNVLHGRGN
ncbi:MAG TPA: hypothetical protein VFJ02_20000 [Vicinamibacterales bacterium]|nr:hypothetical protein [Vicinamibacterales bacterium]